jgi:hypothetical protein
MEKLLTSIARTQIEDKTINAAEQIIRIKFFIIVQLGNIVSANI